MVHEHIKYSEFVKSLVLPGEQIKRNLTALRAHRVHMTLGLAGEVFELMVAAREFSTDQDNFFGKLLSEFGDVEFYLEGIFLSVADEPPLTAFEIPLEAYYVPVGCDDGLHRLLYSVGKLVNSVRRRDIVAGTEGLREPLIWTHRVREELDRLYTNFRLKHKLDISSDSARAHNLLKLKQRFPDGVFTSERALNRLDMPDEPVCF